MNAATPAVPTILDDLASLPERLGDSVSRLRDLALQQINERKLRDRLIVAAVDQAGMSQAKVAKIAGVSQPHVVRILSHSDDDQ